MISHDQWLDPPDDEDLEDCMPDLDPEPDDLEEIDNGSDERERIINRRY